jgi:hypothetical protein
MRFNLLAMVAVAMVGMGGAGAAEIRPGSGPAVLAGALAVLRVNDPRLLDREATQFAAGLGIDPAPMRAGVAKLLFRSRSLDGIDLTRPALMAWRAKGPPLIAVIPLSDRRAFLNSFGAGLGTEAPLIRVGEREGTVVYTQNSNEGLLEYRLLVSDRAAYLAHTTAECRELASFPLQPGLSEAPLVFTASAAFIQGIGGVEAPDPQYTKVLELASGGWSRMSGVMRAAWQGFIGQLQGAELSLRPDHEGTLRFSLQLQALPDSALAVWIGNQRNQPSRLLPLVRSAQSVATLAGNIVWQGQAERLGQVLMPAVKEASEGRWTAMVDENWSAMWALADRAGPFAMATDLDLKDGQPRSESRYLGDQPKAQELMSLITMVSQTLSGVVGEAVTAGPATGYRQRQPGSDSVLVASERYLVSVQSSMRAAPDAAAELVAGSQAIGAPEGAAGVLMMSTNLTPLVRTVVVAMGGEVQPGLPEAACAVTVKTGLPGQLVADGSFPLPKVAQLIRDSGLPQLRR